MEKLDKVIAGLKCCTEERCTRCPYFEYERGCMTLLGRDALTVILDLKTRLDDAKNGRLELGRRCRELEQRLEQTEMALEATRMNLGNSREDCNRLEDENVDLRREIGGLSAELARMISDVALSESEESYRGEGV